MNRRWWLLLPLLALGLVAAAGDQDGDGVADADDDCPSRAGPAPTGCPKEDRDGDGLWDGVDSCPLEAEDINGIRDGDGCPDDPDLVEVQGVVQTRAPYAFPKGRTAPPADVQNLAKAVARWMKGDPRAQAVEVVVILDPGERRQAETLAQDRAAAVAVILGAAGVRSEKITTRVERAPRKGPRPRTLHVRILLGTAERAKATAAEGGAADAGRAATTTEAAGKADGGAKAVTQPDAGGAKAAGKDEGAAGKATATADAGAKPATTGKADEGKAAPTTGKPDAGRAPAGKAEAEKPKDAPDAGVARETAKPDAGTVTSGPADAGVPSEGADDWDKDAWESEEKPKGKGAKKTRK